MEEIYIVGAVRTPIGKFGGTLAKTPAAELGALVIKDVLKRAGLKPEQVSEVIMVARQQDAIFTNRVQPLHGVVLPNHVRLGGRLDIVASCSQELNQ